MRELSREGDCVCRWILALNHKLEGIQGDENLDNGELDSDLVEEESRIAVQTDIVSVDLDAAMVELHQEVIKVKEERDTEEGECNIERKNRVNTIRNEEATF